MYIIYVIPNVSKSCIKGDNSELTSLKSETLFVALLSPIPDSGLSGSTGALPLTVVGTMLTPGIWVVRAGIDWAVVVTLPELWRKRWICLFWFWLTWNCVGFSSCVFTYRAERGKKTILLNPQSHSEKKQTP